MGLSPAAKDAIQNATFKCTPSADSFSFKATFVVGSLIAASCSFFKRKVVPETGTVPTIASLRANAENVWIANNSVAPQLRIEVP